MTYRYCGIFLTGVLMLCTPCVALAQTCTPGETQEVVVALAWAQTGDRLGSVRRLKQHAAALHGFYDAIARHDLTPCPTETTSPVAEVPGGYAFDLFPNPASEDVTVRYRLPAPERVTLRVYDLLGREVQTILRDVEQPAQQHVMKLQRALAAGMYIVRLEAGPYVASRLLVVP